MFSCPDDRVDNFVDTARETLRGMFPSIVANDDYCSSVNEANFDRVVGLIDDARANGATVETVAPARESLPDRATRKVAPTIVRDVDDRMRIANEEIFGPVLVVRPYSELTDVIDYINQRPAPLVAYWYGPDNDDFRRFVRHTRSGGVARNDFGAQMIPSAAPFGGVGRSGMGAYHGKAGFDAFSHYRTVVGTDLPFTITGRAAPPFSGSMRAGARAALRMARTARAVDSSVAADRLLAGPPVVGFACRAALDDRPEHHRLGQLVPGDRACGVVDEFLGIGAGSVDECDDRDDLLPPALARPTRDDHIGHRRMRCDRRLDLLDEDLFATGVDASPSPGRAIRSSRLRDGVRDRPAPSTARLR